MGIFPLHEGIMTRTSVLIVLALLLVQGVSPASSPRWVTLEDFESGGVVLSSYPGEDFDPDDWEVTQSNAYGGTVYSLRLYGNTWKVQSIPPYPITDTTVLQVAAYIERIGEIQAIGFGDGQNEYFYVFSGTQLPTGEIWDVTYQGYVSTGEWYPYLLALGRDWKELHGYTPELSSIVYVNDDDGALPPGDTYFDEIYDVTEDLPTPPTVSIDYEMIGPAPVPEPPAQNRVRFPDGPLYYEVGFHSLVEDPDSDTFAYDWSFGDGQGSDETDPVHVFDCSLADEFTVSLIVTDETGRVGSDVVFVPVPHRAVTNEITMNFVGDIMLARHYEEPGGIIPTQGVEAIFEPTLPYFGDASDVNVCNLESPLTDEGTPHPTKSVVFRGNPDNVAGLTYAGIEVVALGNNHIVDYGEEGMLETFEVVDTSGIVRSGAGVNDDFALRPAFQSIEGLRIGYLSMCNRTGREYNYQPFLEAGPDKIGFGYLLPRTLETWVPHTDSLADLVVIQTHSGEEYQTSPDHRLGGLDPSDPEVIRIPTRPGRYERELRQRAIDLGADLVINHHPHVLQGFEVYEGKLIAHSLGNFVFDLSYLETFPTLILYGRATREGFHEFWFRPAFVDDYIPRVSSGTLARRIIDRLADYSREFGTVIVPDYGACIGRIVIDTLALTTTVNEFEAPVRFALHDGAYVSEPLEVQGPGFLSSVEAATSFPQGASFEISLGREILWFGNFEDEGHSMWNLNSSYEWLDSTVAYSGERSLCLERHQSAGDNVVTNLENRIPIDPFHEYSMTGCMRTENAGDATFEARFFYYRYSGSPMSVQELVPPVTGSHDWTCHWKHLDTPASAWYLNVRGSLYQPDTGTGHAWFDECRVVEWDEWTPFAPSYPVPYPNERTYVRLRTSDPLDSARVTYQKTNHVGAVLDVARDPARASDRGGIERERFGFLGTSPVPFTEAVDIVFETDRKGPVDLSAFDVTGRKVGTVFRGTVEPGRTEMRWTPDGMPCGIYFCRLSSEGRTRVRKVLKLR
jgi:hypothetical protein